MDDHAPKDIGPQHPNDQQSRSLQDHIWNQNQEEGELMRFYWMDNKRPITNTIDFKGGYVWQS